MRRLKYRIELPETKGRALIFWLMVAGFVAAAALYEDSHYTGF